MESRMTPAERSIRMRTDLVIHAPGDRGYQDWSDKRELLRLLDEARDALQRIVDCDYRGNEPPEQAIAREALAQ